MSTPMRTCACTCTCMRTCLCNTYLPVTSTLAGAAAKVAEGRKRMLYSFLLDRYSFVPMAIETSGVWGTEGLRLIKAIGARVSRVTGEARATSFLIQRVSLAVQRGNVAAVLGTLPPARNWMRYLIFSCSKFSFLNVLIF